MMLQNFPARPAAVERIIKELITYCLDVRRPMKTETEEAMEVLRKIVGNEAAVDSHLTLMKDYIEKCQEIILKQKPYLRTEIIL